MKYKWSKWSGFVGRKSFYLDKEPYLGMLFFTPFIDFCLLKLSQKKKFLHSKNDIFISCNKLNSLRTFYLHNCQDVLSFLFLLTFFSFSALNAVIILNSWSSNCNLFEWCFHVFKPHLKIFQPYCFLHYHFEALFHSVNKRNNRFIHI